MLQSSSWHNSRAHDLRLFESFGYDRLQLGVFIAALLSGFENGDLPLRVRSAGFAEEVLGGCQIVGSFGRAGESLE
jgi:hypothetical protein